MQKPDGAERGAFRIVSKKAMASGRWPTNANKHCTTTGCKEAADDKGVRRHKQKCWLANACAACCHARTANAGYASQGRRICPAQALGGAVAIATGQLSLGGSVRQNGKDSGHLR
eukprot:11116127-Alexandrium_andersonii.AAC.1